MDNRFSLSPIMKALSVVFAGMMFSGGTLAAQCASNGGKIATDEKGNCTVSDANSAVTIDANYNAWMKFTGGDDTLTINSSGKLLTDATSGFTDIAAISVMSKENSSWALNNKGTIKTDGYADVIYAGSGGKYTINNSGKIENIYTSASNELSLINSRGASDIDVLVNNSGNIATSGHTFYLSGGNKNSINLTNTSTGIIASTENALIYNYSAGTSDITFTNDGKAEAKAQVVYFANAAKDSTLNIVNRGTITSGGNGGNVFDSYAGGEVNFINSGKISSTAQNYVLRTSSLSDVTINNTGTIETDGAFVDARNMDAGTALTIKNGASSSITSSSKNNTGEFIYTRRSLDLENKGTIKTTNSLWTISANGGANIVNDKSGVIEGSANNLIYTSSAYVAKTDPHYGTTIANKGTIKSSGTGYAIYNNGGTFNLNNSGELSSGNYAVYNDSSEVTNITNSGTIVTTGSIALRGNGGLDIINSGTISAAKDEAYAIWGTFADDKLTLLPGSKITGKVDLASGKNTLILSGDTGSAEFDISQVGKQYTGLNNSVLTKEGKDTWTLTGTADKNQQWKSVDVNAGTLAFGKDAVFDNGDKEYAFNIAEGATAEMGDSATLKVNGKMTIDGTLNVTTGQRAADQAAVIAESSSMGAKSVLNISGFSVTGGASDASKAYSRTLIMTSEDSFGDNAEPFAEVQVGGISSAADHPDYISSVTHGVSGKGYYVGTGLTWFAGACSDANSECNGAINPEDAMGTFTLAKATDVFNADVVLNNQAANGTAWDGKTLTKDGEGTLKLSAVNTYTGDTNVQHGTLQFGVANAIKTSSGVTLANADSVLDLNSFNQTVNNLNGVGSINLGSATLTNNLTKDSEFSGIISGAGNVVVTGGSLFTLSNDNTYTGTTTVSGGTLQLGNGGETGSVAGDVTNNGNVFFNRSNNFGYDNVVSGTGNVIKQNSNHLLFNKDQTYTGNTDIQGGSIILNRASLASKAITVGNGAMLAGYGSTAGNVTNNGTVAIADAAPSMDGFDDSLTGDLTVNGNFINNGTIVMESPLPASTLTVKGNYVGNDGILAIDTVLGDDTSATDKLVVEGNTSGNTNVVVTNAKGVGAKTNEGIQVVNVKGQSDGTFKLKGRVVAGKYDYNLFKGSVSAPEDGDWYLRRADSEEPIINPVSPEAASYLGNQSATVQMFQHGLHDRIGSYPLMNDKQSEEGLVPAFWARVVSHSSTNSSADGINNESDTSVFQMGNDFAQWSTDSANSYHLGWMLGYGHAESDSTNPNAYKEEASKSHGEADGYSVGAYGTWYQNAKTNTGLYIDSSLQYTWYRNKVQSTAGSENYDSDAWLISTETGYTFPLNQNQANQWFIEPQAQVTYNSFNADDHTDANGTFMHDADADGITTRLGTRLSGRLVNFFELQPSLEVNWYRGTAPNSMVITAGGVDSKVYDAMPKDRYEAKAGVQAEIQKDLRVYMNAGYQVGGNGYDDVSGLMGVRYNW